MQVAKHTNFVSVLSEEKPVLVFFHHKTEAAQSKKIKLVLKSIEKELPLLPLYEYIIDDCEENEILAEFLNISKTPILLFFKNGNFHRYKDKAFNKLAIMQFIGNTKNYVSSTTNETEAQEDTEIE